MTLRWTRRAKADLEGIASQLGADDPVMARRMVSRIRERMDAVLAFPESCPLLSDGLSRRCVVSGTLYLVYYRVLGRIIVVDAVFHHRQDRPV